ncbi:hypothetical protein Clacol_003626 [Clathrus columnatus]|uniref:CSC1/OSCA1-like 7TM region domain-containing protein n=1 Tax=Clathrus columnatus TaxID=1419009 RepID=A0AAV5A435_9AGAM|nr:hypothetical protein Clacol_003626 [Clathrus columnatus]
MVHPRANLTILILSIFILSSQIVAIDATQNPSSVIVKKPSSDTPIHGLICIGRGVDSTAIESNSTQLPSDEELAQRTLWHAFSVVCFCTIVGLGGGLPLYLVRTPCVADVLNNDPLGGRFSTLQDLSIFRLLTLLDNGVSTQPTTRNRLIIIAVLVMAVITVPSALKFLYEFHRLITYRRLWLDRKCGGVEMGWLSLADAYGFAGWNENDFKDYLVQLGLSQGFQGSGSGQSNVMVSDVVVAEHKNDISPEIDIQNLFAIGDTSLLARLIQERDVILNNLEVAEIQYINSFQLSTPIPSIADYEIPEPPPTVSADFKQRISRPKALRGSIRTRAPNRRDIYTLGSAPTTYLAPSSFYRLRDIRTSQMSTQNTDDNLAARISQRVIGTRFQEVQRGSRILSRIFSWGNVLPPENLAGIGSMNLHRFSTDQLRHGPNEPLSGNIAGDEVLLQDGFQNDNRWLEPVTEERRSDPSNGNHNVSSLTSSNDSEFSFSRSRIRRTEGPPDRRSTFAMRLRPGHFALDTDPIPPPHLRLQSQRPFVRPVSGMDHDQLGIIYNNIREWRSRLKVINMEISEAQQSGFDSIVNGNEIKGWLLVGRGLRHLSHIQMIEGRSKEDISYEQLQLVSAAVIHPSYHPYRIDIQVIPTTGLVVSFGPGVTHYLHVFQHLTGVSTIAAGLATTLAPASLIVLIIWFTLPIIRFASQTTGIVSASLAYVKGFKATFIFLNATYGFWLVACGSVIFSLESFAVGVHRTQAVADGILYFASFLIVLTFALAMIYPALWIIQPMRLAQFYRRKNFTLTPRQRFRTHRYLISCVYIKAPQTGGLLQLWLLRRLANLMVLQPLILGLILLTRQFRVLGGALVGISVLLLSCIELYAWFKLRLVQPNSISSATKEKVQHLARAAKSEIPSYNRGYQAPDSPLQPARSSVATVLEMMSITLAVMPPNVKRRGPIPLSSEVIDDLTVTELAARTNPDAPPRLPPLPFMTHTEEMHSVLYAPELLAPSPIIWLPNDSSGVAETEAVDLFRYHDLQTTLDV